MVRKVFTQIFSFINVQLFNRYVNVQSSPVQSNIYLYSFMTRKTFLISVFVCSLLLRRECCSFSNGEYVKAGLAELEHWCYKATDEVPT